MMVKRGPEYSYRDFLKACEKKEMVYVQSGAKKDAMADFELATEKAIREYIVNLGEDSASHINTATYKKSGAMGFVVDAYNVEYGPGRSIYLAFYHAERTGKWIIKSFKKSVSGDMTHKPFAALSNLKLKGEK